MVFTALTLTQMAHVLAIRSEGTTALQLATIYVPWLQPLFKTVPLGFGELGI